jgi:hypothetical protein
MTLVREKSTVIPTSERRPGMLASDSNARFSMISNDIARNRSRILNLDETNTNVNNQPILNMINSTDNMTPTLNINHNDTGQVIALTPALRNDLKTPIQMQTLIQTPIQMTSSMPIQPKTRGRAKKDILKPISHPIFEYCSEYTNDPRWKEQLKAFARDTFPPYVMYRDGILSFKKGKSIEKVVLSTDKGLQYLTDFICNFFREKVGIWSDMDSESMNRNFEERMMMNEQKDLRLKDIRRKNQKEKMFLDYADMKQEEWDLTKTERKELLKIINLGQCKKTINDHTIMEHNRIKDISGISFNTETREFNFDEIANGNGSGRTKATETPSKVKSLPELWDKWTKTVVEGTKQKK